MRLRSSRQCRPSFLWSEISHLARALAFISKSISAYTLVVSIDTCPSHARIVLMPMPARRRCIAVVWRIVWGLTRLVGSDGIRRLALSTQRSTSVWMPKRVIGWPQRLRKTRSRGPRYATSSVNSRAVAGQSGQQRSLLPLPRILTDAGGVRSRSAMVTCAASSARALEL